MYAFLNYISMHSIIFRTNGISFSWCVSGTFQKPSGKNSLDMITKESTCCLQPRSEKLLSGRRHLWNDLPGNREEQRDTHTSCRPLLWSIIFLEALSCSGEGWVTSNTLPGLLHTFRADSPPPFALRKHESGGSDWVSSSSAGWRCCHSSATGSSCVCVWTAVRRDNRWLWWDTLTCCVTDRKMMRFFFVRVFFSPSQRAPSTSRLWARLLLETFERHGAG